MKNDNLAAVSMLIGLGITCLALGAFDWRLGMLLLGLFLFETGRRGFE